MVFSTVDWNQLAKIDPKSVNTAGEIWREHLKLSNVAKFESDKRLLNFETLWSNIWSIFARFGHITFKPGKSTHLKTLFPAVPMDIR